MEREIFEVQEEEIDDYTSEDSWEIKGEMYMHVKTSHTNGDGEWHKVIVQRESDKKYFQFEWGY